MEYINQQRQELMSDPNVRRYVQDEVARHESAEKYLESVVDRLWADNKSGKGVDTGLTTDAAGDTKRWASSNNSQLMRAAAGLLIGV